ncbi:reticulon-1-A-like [Parambassis ranga]|uniref:Reticulon n=1 Tax=Parambassis ranga TaxID=210632 RepID=A0A6P7JSJ0_9TELE|nr:reticulon-1-A-like [Parambassis ranga]
MRKYERCHQALHLWGKWGRNLCTPVSCPGERLGGRNACFSSGAIWSRGKHTDLRPHSSSLPAEYRQYLDHEVALSEDMVHKYSDLILAKINKTICELRRLFLVQDLVDSIKFAVLMWILTYVGALFNGLTLLILGLVAVFSCPIVYEKHQAQIGSQLEPCLWNAS